MILLSPEQQQQLRSWFLPDRPGNLLALHVYNSGLGKIYVDRWPDPQSVLAETGGNYSLLGDSHAFTAADLQGNITGFLDAPPTFLPLLRECFPDLQIWERIILALEADLDPVPAPKIPIRRLGKDDVNLLERLSEDVAWISKTWNGIQGLAESGYAFAAVRGGRILSLACSYFVGDTYEDIGVVTEAEHRGQGLSTACTHALCRDIIGRGRRPCWSTSTDNQASQRVAAKLGFTFQRHDRLFAVNQPIPAADQ